MPLPPKPVHSDARMARILVSTDSWILGTDRRTAFCETHDDLALLVARPFFLFILTPAGIAGADDGIEEIQASGLVLRCFQTVTGIKFVLTAEPTTTVDLEYVLREIYTLYTDCVLKDPFYELEMPIRSELFVQAVDDLLERATKTAGMSTVKTR